MRGGFFGGADRQTYFGTRGGCKRVVSVCSIYSFFSWTFEQVFSRRSLAEPLQNLPRTLPSLHSSPTAPILIVGASFLDQPLQDLEVLQWMRAQDPPCPWKRDWFGMAGRVTAKRKLAQKSMKRKNRYCREAVNLHPASMYKDTNLPPPRPKVCLSVRSSKRIHLSLTASSRCSGVQGRRLVRHDTHLLQAIASSIIFLHFC